MSDFKNKTIEASQNLSAKDAIQGVLHCFRVGARWGYAEAQKEMESLAKENANLFLAAKSWERESKINEENAKDLKAERDEYREALEFYANETNWDYDIGYFGPKATIRNDSEYFKTNPTITIAGKRAREVLKKYEVKE